MATEIEQKVVQMKFDNAKFESGVRTTISSLEKLKTTLRFDTVANGFKGITNAAKNVDLSSIGVSADAISVKFSALEVFTFETFRRISNAAINTGKTIVSSFTIDPIKSGFQEYETQMNAVQTILANTKSKGNTLEDVNKALAELNTYADKTIYNFTEMTKNIGTFTAAGVELDVSVQAIKGIANLAAISGSSSQQASTAMYQLSQALASGRVALQDWNSVVNAGMGGEVFQNALIETAQIHGINVRQMIKEEGSFRETLTKNAWLTSDILTETLAKFTGDLTKEQLLAKGYTEEQANAIIELGQMSNDAATKVKTFTQLMDTLKEAAQSGWSQTWQILVGDFEEAKKLYTSISDALGAIIGKSAEARNNMLQGWKDLGGRDKLIEGFRNIWESVYGIITKVGEAFRDVFPRTTSQELFNLTDGFVKLTEKLKPSENTLNAVKMAFKGVFEVVKLFVSIIKIPLKLLPSLVDILSTLGSIVTKVAGFFGGLAGELLDFISAGDGVSSVFGFIAGVIGKATGAVQEFITGINVPMGVEGIVAAVPMFGKVRDAAISAKDGILNYVREGVAAFKNLDKEALKTKVVDTLERVVNKALEVYNVLKNELSQAIDFGKGIIDTAFQKLKQFVEWVDWQQVFEFFTGAVATKFFLTLAKVLDRLSKAFSTVADNTSVLTNISKSIGGAFDAVSDSLQTWQNSLKSSNLMRIAIAVAAIAGSIALLATVDVDKLIPALGAVTTVFLSLTASSLLLAKYADGKTMKGLVSMATAIFVLTGAVKMLSKIDPVKMGIGLAGVVGLVTTIGVFSVTMSKMKAEISSGSMVLIGFATAITILTAAVLNLTKVGPGQLAVAMTGIMGLSLTVAASSKILGKNKADNKATIQLVAFASSIKQLAKSVKLLSDLKWGEMAKGLVGVGTLMAALAVFTNSIKADSMIAVGIGLNFVATAITLLTVPIGILGNMDLMTLVTGISSIAVMMGALSKSLKIMPRNMPGIGLGLMMVSGALVTMSGAIAIVGKQNIFDLAKSITTFGIALGGLAVALNMMTGTIGASGALLVASTALVALSAAIGLMGAFSLGTVAVGLIGFGGALMILSSAALSLVPATPALAGMALAMVGFTASLTLGAVAVGAFGVALVALAGGLTAIAGMGAAFFKMMEGVVKTFAGLVPIIGKAAADLVVAFISGLSQGKNALRNAFVDFILVTLDAINEVVPQFVETVLNVVEKVFESLARHTEPIIKNVVKFIIGIIRGISAHLPELVTEAVNLVVTLFSSITDAISNIDLVDLGKVITGAGLMGGLTAVLSMILPTIPTAALTLAALGGIVMEMIGILGLIGGLAQIPGLKWLVGEGGEILQKVGGAIGKFAGGIIGGVTEGVVAVLPKIGKHLSDFINSAKPFFDGIKSIDQSSIKSIASLAAAVTMLTATSLVDGIISFFRGGESTLTRFGKELASFAPYYKQYADIMSSTNGSELEKSSNAIKSIGEFVKMVPSQSGLSKLLLGERDLVEFGKTLAAFAPNFAQYARSISGIDSDAVIASSAAAESLAAFADKIPNKGGLLGLLVGENSLADFGEELASFGPHLKSYATSVRGIDANIVTASASAASALATFAEKIPNKGGLIALFTGDNSLSSLAKDLTKFGPALKAYSDSVVGLNLSSIMSSIKGSTALIDLAKVIPTSKIRLSVLGDELEDFGKSIGKYYERIANVSFSHISSSVNALNKLIDMCSKIDGVNVYGMEQFAEGLGKLSGNSITKFTSAFDGSHDKARTSVSNFVTAAASGITANKEVLQTASSDLMNSVINTLNNGAPRVQIAMTSIFMNVTAEVQNGINAAKSKIVELVSSLSTSIMSRLPSVVSAMTTLMNQVSVIVQSKSSIMLNAGSTMVGNITIGIRNGQGALIGTVSTMLNGIVASVNNYNSRFRSAGYNVINNLNSGLSSVSSNVVNNISNILNKAKNTVESKNSSYRQAGATLMKNLADGITSNEGRVRTSASTGTSKATTAIRSNYSSWYNAGRYLVEGFSSGINDYTYLATAKARAMANAANRSARNALGIHSPSRVGAEIGMYLVQGFAGGISDNMDESTKQSRSMAENAKDALKNALASIPDIASDDMDLNPTITPVLDLTNVQKSGKLLDNMFTTDIAARTSAGMLRTITGEDITSTGSVTNVNNTIQNEFNIVAREGDDPNVVAHEVSRIIQRQIERRDAVWE